MNPRKYTNYTKAAAGITIVLAELVGPPDAEHVFVPDTPTEPILVRHAPPTVIQGSNPIF